MRTFFLFLLGGLCFFLIGCSLMGFVQEFVVLGTRGIENIDPHYVESSVEKRIAFALFEGLVRADPETGAALPGLAESWEISADGLQYSFTLRKAVWSDGIRINAQTVVDSWIRGMDPQTASPNSWYPGMFIRGAREYISGVTGPEVVGIRAIDDYLLQVELIRPMPHFIQALIHPSFLLIPMHLVDKFGPSWTDPGNFSGNGVFTVLERGANGGITLVRNEQHRNAGKTALKKLVYRVVPEINIAVDLFLDGTADWVWDLPDVLPQKLYGEPSLHISPALENYYLLVNNERAPFNDPRVRRALALGFNRKELIDTVAGGRYVPAYSITPANLPGYSAGPFFEDNPAEARTLLAEAGYPDGKGFPAFSILYNRSDFNREVLEFIAASWRENLNLSCEPVNEEWGSYLITRRLHDFSLARAGWMGDYPDPLAFLSAFISIHENNDGLYRNLAFDETLLNAENFSYGQERFGQLARAEEILVAEDMGAIPVLFRAAANLIDTEKWDGWYPNSLDLHPFSSIRRR